MRGNGVYDNTRIILVVDHRRGLGQFNYILITALEFDIES